MSVARAAAIDSALANSVPPVATCSAQDAERSGLEHGCHLRRSSRTRRAGCRSRSPCPERPGRAGAPSGRPDHRARTPGCGSRRAPAARRVRMRAGAARRGIPRGVLMTPVLVTAASARTHATSPRANSRSTTSRSLYWASRTWRVASVGTPRPSGATRSPAELAEQFVGVPVVLAVEHQYPAERPVTGTGYPDRLGVGLRRRQRELPVPGARSDGRAPEATSMLSSVGSRNCGPPSCVRSPHRVTASTP